MNINVNTCNIGTENLICVMFYIDKKFISKYHVTNAKRACEKFYFTLIIVGILKMGKFTVEI